MAIGLVIAGGLNPQILVAVAFCDKSMKIGGETYLEQLNRSRRSAHLADLFGGSQGGPKVPPRPYAKKKIFL